MTLTPLILAADDMSLGRLDPTLLSDQARMEMTFENVENKTGIIDSAGNYHDISAWDILELCPEGRVWKIRSSLREGEPGALGGQFNFAFLPDSIGSICLDNNNLLGSLGARDLPTSLEVLLLRGNRIEGTLDISALPRGMTFIALTSNTMHGALDCTAFPPDLKHLYIAENKFLGSLDLTNLPNGLESFHANRNEFTGSIDLTRLNAAL